MKRNLRLIIGFALLLLVLSMGIGMLNTMNNVNKAAETTQEVGEVIINKVEDITISDSTKVKLKVSLGKFKAKLDTIDKLLETNK